MNDEQKSARPGTPSSRFLLGLAGLTVVCGLAGSSCTFVDESEWVLVERLGKIAAIYDQPADRGLKFKLPWPLDAVRRFDARVQLHDPPGGEMVTADKKNVTVDSFLCWRIATPDTAADTTKNKPPLSRFFTALGDHDTARTRLAEHVLPALRTRLGETEFGQLVDVHDSGSGPDVARPGLLVTIPKAVRKELAALVLERYGIELIDVRIKRLNFPRQNQVAVFERMKTERKKIAEEYRSDGLAENTKIKSRADLQYSEIIANAQQEADVIRGRADAESLSILNQAHRRDPEFYRFTRTLDSYRLILNDRTTLVLSASNSLLKLLTEGVRAEPTDAPAPRATSAGKEGSR